MEVHVRKEIEGHSQVKEIEDIDDMVPSVAWSPRIGLTLMWDQSTMNVRLT